MKRMGVLLTLVMVIAMALCPAVYADSEFAINQEATTPSPIADKMKQNLQPAGVAIKIKFTTEVISEEAQAANKDCFVITNEDGEEQPYIVLQNASKYPQDIWVLIDGALESDSMYEITVSGDLRDDAGQTLGQDVSWSFKTRNTATDNNISMVMMIGMMVAMFFFSSMETKKKAKKQAEEKGVPQENLNPYKIAKEKGISLQEATAYVEKEKAKLEKKRAQMEEDDDEEDEDFDNGNFRVAKKRTIAEAGGKTPKTILDQKAKKRAEAEKARQEKLRRDKARAKKKK